MLHAEIVGDIYSIQRRIKHGSMGAILYKRGRRGHKGVDQKRFPHEFGGEGIYGGARKEEGREPERAGAMGARSY